MNGFFDTSALVPLIFREPQSQRAHKAWGACSSCFGWDWLRVEAEAALVRRKGCKEAWGLWRMIETNVRWLKPQGEWNRQVKAFNRGAGLRAADAGHLCMMECCLEVMPDLVLVTFDSEMIHAATKRGFEVF